MPRTSGTPDLGVDPSFEPELPTAVARSTTDPRAERTRRTVLQAVETILAGRPDRVSVGDIVRTAGISRSSFYAHFSSLDELTAVYLRARLSDGDHVAAADDTSSPALARQAYRRLVDRLLEDAPLYSSVLDLPISRGAFDELVGERAESLVSTLLPRVDVPPHIPVAFVARYVAGGTLSLVEAWRRERLDVSDDELVDALVALLPDWLLADTDRPA